MGILNLLLRNKFSREVNASFWEHLDELRSVFFKAALITAIVGTVVFCFKETLFSVILAPTTSDFFFYRWIGDEPFTINLVNVDLTEQFMMHFKTAIYVGLLLASPYILYALFGFVAPALHENERRYAGTIVVGAYLMFLLGTALNYCMIFPFTLKFMGTYSVDPSVTNMLSLRSYINTMLTMSLLMGLMFELPVVCWILGRIGVLSAKAMSKYRRHAIIVIFTAAAIITPTTDIFSLLLVSVPIWLLYEISILLVALTGKKRKKKASEAPETPETSADPDQPNQPDNPNQPDKPDEPDEPDEPDNPDQPDETSDPDDPDKTAKPDKPEEPEESDSPEQPEEAKEAETPDTPAPQGNSDSDLDWESSRLRDWGYDK